MTYKADLERIRNSVNWIFTEADQLREKLNQEIEKNAILQKQIEERDSEINQLKEIANLLGQPTIETWPGLANMPLLKSGSCELPFDVKKGGRNNKNGRSNFLDKFSDLSTSGILLLSNLLQYNPESRWTVENAITSEWFKEYPLPSKLNEMPSFPWKK